MVVDDIYIHYRLSFEEGNHVWKKTALVIACMAGISCVTSPAAVADPTSAIEVSAQSNIEAVREAQEQYRQTATPEDYAAAMRAYEELRTTGAISETTLNSGPNTATLRAACISIPKWAIVAYGWNLKAGGYVSAITATGVSGTIIGLPAAQVLIAIGAIGVEGGQGLINWAESTTWPKQICI